MPKNPVTGPITEGLANLNLGRDQILARLWQLAILSPEETRGSIAGQIKALSMIVAIEGLIPGRLSAAQAQPARPPAQPPIVANPFVHPAPLNPVPEATRFAYDAIVSPAAGLGLSLPPRGFFNRGRSNR